MILRSGLRMTVQLATRGFCRKSGRESEIALTRIHFCQRCHLDRSGETSPKTGRCFDFAQHDSSQGLIYCEVRVDQEAAQTHAPI